MEVSIKVVLVKISVMKDLIEIHVLLERKKKDNLTREMIDHLFLTAQTSHVDHQARENSVMTVLLLRQVIEAAEMKNHRVLPLVVATEAKSLHAHHLIVVKEVRSHRALPLVVVKEAKSLHAHHLIVVKEARSLHVPPLVVVKEAKNHRALHLIEGSEVKNLSVLHLIAVKEMKDHHVLQVIDHHALLEASVLFQEKEMANLLLEKVTDHSQEKVNREMILDQLLAKRKSHQVKIQELTK
jgi:hypothetical protein